MNPIYSLHNDSCIENQKLCRMCKKKSSVQKLRSRFDDFRSDEVFLGGPYRQAFLDTAYQLPYAHDLQSNSTIFYENGQLSDVNYLELLSMHSSMSVNDDRINNIQIGFWNPKKSDIDDHIQYRRRTQSTTVDPQQRNSVIENTNRERSVSTTL